MSAVFFYFLVGMQGALMSLDEFHFHRRRGLGLWERWGHPVDSFVFFLALISILLWGTGPLSITLAVISSLLITKDEWVHTQTCGPQEHWLHAMLFVLHPAILIFAHLSHGSWGFEIPTAVLLFCAYQIYYWNFYANRTVAARSSTR